MKICRFRRRVVGSLFLFVMLFAIVLTYAALLRSNKAVRSTFRLHKKHVRRGGVGKKSHHLPTELPVYVVEEHHRALPYWLDAANKKIIPKSGNTLLHIDSHPNFALPLYLPEYPLFRWPHRNHIQFLMQRNNDAFIMAAVFSGLIDRFIWVCPKWHGKRQNRTYSVKSMDFGWIKIADMKKSPSNARVFCMCSVNNKSKECFMHTIKNAREVKKNIPVSHCHVKRSLMIETLSEDVALQKMKHGTWINKGKNLLLDIDEDFHGLESSVVALLSSGIKPSFIFHLNRDMKQIFCPKLMRHETEADEFLVKILDQVLKLHEAACRKGKVENCKTFPQPVDISHLVSLFHSENTSHYSGLVCKRKWISKNIYQLLKNLANLHVNQIRTLKEIGFCFPSTMKLFSTIQVCQGSNSLSNSTLRFHRLNQKEIATRLGSLKNILLETRRTNLKVVTLSRSVRDGHVPGRHFYRVEKDVLSTLRHVHSNIKIHYDHALLGGRLGWEKRPSRNSSMMSKQTF